MKTKLIKIAKLFLKWLCIIGKWLLIIGGIVTVSFIITTHPTVSMYIKPVVALIFILFFGFALYILDKTQVNKMWSDFIEEFNKNKSNTKWLIDKRDLLYNIQNTNVFRKGLHRRMYTQCVNELAEIKSNKDKQFKKLEINLAEENALNNTYKIENESLKEQNIKLKEIITSYKNDLRVISKDNQKLKDSIEKLEKDSHYRKSSKLFLNDKDGYKINFYRVINALCKLNFFYGEGQKEATQFQTFTQFGITLNFDTTNFHNNLSQAYSSKKSETNYAIFNEMIEKTKEIVENKTE